ncbi:aldehyde ferredoxin oxidoreductase family protein [Candidatus Hodarchaeum mangrovi]
MSISNSRLYRLAIIDLTNKSVSLESIGFSEEKFLKFLGGHGIVIDYLLRNMPAKVDPLSPDNFLCFITGIFSATRIPFSGRFTVASKSPLTNTWGEANCGGRFGPELRKSGFDGLIIKGKSKELSILRITDDSVEIISSPHLKGKDCLETEEILQNQYGKVHVASIGLAGENKVLISGIVTDKGRIAARSGLGAVMGSKNLKAIVVSGTKDIPVSDPDGLTELRKLVNKRINKGISSLMEPALKASTIFAPWIRRFRIKNFGSMSPSNLVIEGYRKWGTCAGTAIAVETGDGPVKNWGGSHKDFPLKNSIKITGDNVIQYQIKSYGCHSCPMACGGIMRYSDERYTFEDTHKPEYETLAMLGSNLLNDDLGSIFQLNDFCNRQGVDTIAAGALIAYAIEAQETGRLTAQDLEGLILDWGHPQNYLAFLELIVHRRGLGDRFAEGLKAVEKELGEEYAMHIQNQPIPAHDPRYSKTLVLPYRIDPAPGRHTAFMELMIGLSKYNEMYPELDKKDQISNFYFYNQLTSSLGLCQFSLVTGNFPIAEFLKLTLGSTYSGKELAIIGERIFTLKHLFNIREGINPLAFKLPTRLLKTAISGPNKGITVEEENQIIRDFYNKLKWDLETSLPNKNHLQDLGLIEYSNLLDTPS